MSRSLTDVIACLSFMEEGALVKGVKHDCS